MGRTENYAKDSLGQGSHREQDPGAMEEGLCFLLVVARSKQDLALNKWGAAEVSTSCVPGVTGKAVLVQLVEIKST